VETWIEMRRLLDILWNEEFLCSFVRLAYFSFRVSSLITLITAELCQERGVVWRAGGRVARYCTYGTGRRSCEKPTVGLAA
jgi:hypothetical protein